MAKAAAPPHEVREHFAGREPAVKATYNAVLASAKKLGPVREEAKRTSIHLVRKTAFAGVATRKSALILTLKSDREIASARIVRSERTSANRWHHEVKLANPGDVDGTIEEWIARAYALAI